MFAVKIGLEEFYNNMKNGNEKTREKKRPKPKYTIHDFKPKKRYTKEEREKIEAGMEFLEIIRKSIEKSEQNEEASVG